MKQVAILSVDIERRPWTYRVSPRVFMWLFRLLPAWATLRVHQVKPVKGTEQ